MHRIHSLLSAFVLTFILITFSACQQDHDAGEAAEAPAGTSSVEMADGVQVVKISVTGSGYSPRSFRLQEGVPARLIFHRTVEGECPEQVQIPDFGIEKTTLPLNEDYAIEFTPTKSGAFTFACGMDMLKGTIVVEP